jgi:DNA-binding transcriptional regulator YiaG
MTNWHSVILQIKRARKWPRKTIASQIGVGESTLREWQRGKSEPRHSQGEALLRLAEAIDE